MEILLRILGVLIAIAAAALTVLMLLRFRRPRRITALGSLLGFIVSLALLAIYIPLSGLRIRIGAALPLLTLGILVGFARAQLTELRFEGGRVVGRHSLLFILGWGFSLVLSQFINLFGSGLLISLGLLPVFLSTGTQMGMQGNLFLRRIAMVAPDRDSGRLRNPMVQRGIGIAFGGVLLLLFLDSLVFAYPDFSVLWWHLSRPTAVSEAEGPHATPSPAVVALEEGPTRAPEATSTEAPLFAPTEVLIWTRPDWAFLTEGPYELYAVDVETREARLVTDPPITTLFTPALSPDRRQAAYIREIDQNVDIFLRPITGGEAIRLTESSGRDSTPLWSLDGEWIYFYSDREGTSQCYRMRSDGSDETKLTAFTMYPRGLSLSPAGDHLAFFLGSESDQGELHVMGVDGSGLRRLSQTQAGWQTHGFGWEPGGQRILLTIRDELYNIHQILLRVDGTGEEAIPFELNSVGFTWSPDGSQMAFDRLMPFGEWEHSQILRINADGTGLTNLTAGEFEGQSPIWSPDGAWIAFESSGRIEDSEVIGNWEVHAVRPDGSDLRQLTDELWPENYLPTEVLWP